MLSAFWLYFFVLLPNRHDKRTHWDLRLNSSDNCQRSGKVLFFSWALLFLCVKAQQAWHQERWTRANSLEKDSSVILLVKVCRYDFFYELWKIFSMRLEKHKSNLRAKNSIFYFFLLFAPFLKESFANAVEHSIQKRCSIL